MFPETVLNDSRSSQSISFEMNGIRENQFVVVEEKLPQPGICFTWGGAHYKTFDGRVYRYYTPKLICFKVECLCGL